MVADKTDYALHHGLKVAYTEQCDQHVPACVFCHCCATVMTTVLSVHWQHMHHRPAGWSALQTIVCVGETLEQREAGKLWDVLEGQLNAVSDKLSTEDWDGVVIAYEPVRCTASRTPRSHQ